MPRAGKLVSLLLKRDVLNIVLFPEQIYLVLNLILCFRHHWLIYSHGSNRMFSAQPQLPEVTLHFSLTCKAEC